MIEEISTRSGYVTVHTEYIVDKINQLIRAHNKAELAATDSQQGKHKICPECGTKWVGDNKPGYIECTCGAWL